MVKDSTPSQVATNSLQSLPLGSIIGGPLKACTEAQKEQVKAAAELMKEVRLNPDKEAKERLNP